MTVVGNIQHAAVLLNKLRTKPFYESKPGEMIWRLEVWHFEKPDETWIKIAGRTVRGPVPRAAAEERTSRRKSLTLDPALGGIELTEKRPTVDVGKVALPDEQAGHPVAAEQKWTKRGQRDDGEPAA